MKLTSPSLPALRLLQLPAALAAGLLVSACGGGDASAPLTPLLAQTLSFPAFAAQRVGALAPALAATASSGLTVSYVSTTPAVCTASGTGTAITLVAAGTCSIAASQSGNASYAAATAVNVSFAVGAALIAQTLTFPTPGNQVLGTTPAALAATLTSGLVASYVSTTPSICTVIGSSMTLLSAGSCSITASQAGNTTYAAAASVTDGFTVAAAPVATITFASGFAAAGKTVEGGAFYGYSGSNLDGYNCSGAPNWCGSGAATVSSTVSAANSSFYYYYQTPSPASGEYVGIDVNAPGLAGLSSTGDSAGVQLTGQTTVKFNFGNNPEWLASSTPNVAVILTLGKLEAAGGGCHVQLLAVVTPTASAPTSYVVPLSSFAVIQNCADNAMTSATAALALQTVAKVSFQGTSGASVLPAVGGKVAGTNLTQVVSGVYPTTVVLQGGITFQ